MKVMLLFPPHWTPTMPHLALPALTAYLRAGGVEVIQRDLNLEVFDRILTRAHLQRSLQRLRRIAWPPARHLSPPPEIVQSALEVGPQLVGQVEVAKAVMRGDAFYEGPASLRAFQVLVQSLEIASLPYYPASLEFGRYVPAAPVDGSESLLRAVRDPQHNVFIDLYRQGVLPEIKRERPDMVAISISTMDQMLAGMTLAYEIKRAGIRCHVTVGGPHISMLREQIARAPRLFDLFDSAVAFSGQVPLLRLAEVLDGAGDLSQVPNLIYRDGDEVRVNAPSAPIEIDALPLPDYDGLPLDRYLIPKLVLPLLTAHGCYYGQCAFCNQGYGGSEPFSQLSAEHLVEQMMALHDRYGVRHIFFADEAITPRNLREMSSRLEALGSPLEWIGCARFERALTTELLESMYRGGCRMLLFGLEAASQPVIDRIGKGTQLEEVRRILRQSAKAGIWNHIFFFFGFPGETISDAQETVNLIYGEQQHVHSAAPGTFLLERYAPAHRFPERYGIKRVSQPPESDLAIYFDYQVESGMDEEMAELAMSRLLDVLPTRPFGQYYVHDTYRFLYASHLREQGKPLPPWLVPEAQDAR